MQTLYEGDFRSIPDAELSKVLRRNIAEFAPGLDDTSFPERIVEGVSTKRTELDDLITKAAPEWPLQNVAIVDRNVLRIGLWELLFGNYKEVPPKVAINEAIELGKTFGGDKAGKFVNGVLGTIYRELGEPGKEEKSKKVLAGLDVESLPVEEKVGAIVYRATDKGVAFAMVHDVFGYWTLSKGSVKDGNTPETMIPLILEREIGIKSAHIDDTLGNNEYIAHDPTKGPVRRRVVYYLVRTDDDTLTLGESGGLDDVRWFGVGEVDKLRTYPDIAQMFMKAKTILASGYAK